MKVLILASALLVVVLASDPHGIKPVHKKCQSDPETHVDESVFEDLKKNHEKAVLPPNFKKHVLCMVKGLHMMTDDGKISTTDIKSHVEHVIHEATKVDQIVQECAVDEATPEDTAKHVWTCLHKNHVLGKGPHGSDESSSDESGSNEHHHEHHH